MMCTRVGLVVRDMSFVDEPAWEKYSSNSYKQEDGLMSRVLVKLINFMVKRWMPTTKESAEA